MRNEIVRQKQHQCSLCKEVLTDDYVEQNPFPEIQCPCCGSLMELSLDADEEIAPQNSKGEERCGMSLNVTYKSFNRFIIDYTRNVRKRRMFIKTKAYYEKGSRLDVLLNVPGLGEPVRILGRVVQNSLSGKGGDAGIGIEFVDIDEKSRERLIKSLRAQKGLK